MNYHIPPYIFILYLIFNLSYTHTQAQLVNTGNPKSWKIIQSKKEIPKKAFYKVRDLSNELEKQQLEDSVRDQYPKMPWRFGYEVNVDIDTEKYGLWTVLDNGDQIWQIQIESENATSLNFVFDNYELTKGATLHLYDDQHQTLLGAYTNLLEQKDKHLGTWIISSDKVWIELYEPKEVKDKSKIHISKIIHGYRSIEKNHNNINSKALNDSGICNFDINCNIDKNFNPYKERLKASIGMIIINNQSCSGTLINNVNNDKSPYFITARHCLHTYYNENEQTTNPNEWAFRFNWIQPDPVCQQAYPNNSTIDRIDFVESTNGCTVLVENEKTDILLVRIGGLNSSLPEQWNLEWTGWNLTEEAPKIAYSIHHPKGDVMKISRTNAISFKENIMLESISGNTELDAWIIDYWTEGATEEGSSGGGLFNETGQFIGQLWGGDSKCVNNSTEGNFGSDYYGAFSRSWNADNGADPKLSNFLNPNNTNITSLKMLSEELGNTISMSTEDNKSEENKAYLAQNPLNLLKENKIIIKNLISKNENTKLAYKIIDLQGTIKLEGGVSINTELFETSINIQSINKGIYFISVYDKVTDEKYMKNDYCKFILY